MNKLDQFQTRLALKQLRTRLHKLHPDHPDTFPLRQQIKSLEAREKATAACIRGEGR